MAKCSTSFHELKPVLLMVLVQTVYSLVNICYKLAANDGMNLSVLVGYRFLFGAAFILPVAFFAERKKRPKLTRKIALYGFLCGLFGGALGQNLYLKSLVLTSATFASAMTNLIPAITFLVAFSLRLERLAWNTAAGKAKVLGTMLGIGGAMILTFYKGLELQPWNTNINLLETTATHHHHSGLPQNQLGSHRYVVGAALSLASCLCYSLWLIVQAKAGEEYPCPYSITAMMAVAASVQGVAYALCVERDWSQWNLGWDIRLFTVAFSGILGSGMMFSLVAWCVRKRGPLFVSIFQPLMLVMVALGGSLFLEEKLHLGMVIGAIFIVGGLYIVLWGKRKEIKAYELTENVENEDIPAPVVQSGNSNNRASGADIEIDVEEEAHTDIPALVVQSGNSNNRASGADIEIDVEEEAHTNIPAPVVQSGNSNNSASRAYIEIDVGEEAHTDIPAPVVQSGNSNNRASGAYIEAHTDILEPVVQSGNSNNRASRTDIEVDVEEEAHTNMHGSNHSNSSHSCSSNRVEVPGRRDLPSPLETQNDSIHGSSSSGTVVKEKMQIDSSGRMVEEQMKGHCKEMQSEMEAQMATDMATQLEARLQTMKAEMQAQLDERLQAQQQAFEHILAQFTRAPGPSPPPPPPS